jgi:hypothetical protein
MPLNIYIVRGFLAGAPLSFQPGKAAGLDAVYHFILTGPQAREATMSIRNRRLGSVKGCTACQICG